MKMFSYGFTLIELLMSLAILSLTISIGLPQLNTLLAHQTANTEYRALFSLLQYSRSQSVFYSSQVIVCPSINQIDCINDWSAPLIVFVDRDHNETLNEADTLLRVSSGTSHHSTWRFNAFPRSPYLRFNYDGSYNGSNGRLSYCIKNGESVYTRQIIIAKSGRARRGDDADALKRCA